MAPIPSLLAVAGVHHHLVRDRTRTQVGLVVESGEPARCITWRCWSAAGLPRSTLTWCSSRIEDMLDRGALSGTVSTTRRR